jgi:microcystin-dependent protein
VASSGLATTDPASASEAMLDNFEDEILGTITLFAGDYSPIGFKNCNGQSLAISQYTNLYELIGNTYGGNSTSFNLPNLNASLPFPGGKAPHYLMNVSGKFPMRANG